MTYASITVRFCALVLLAACSSKQPPAAAISSNAPSGASGTETAQAGMAGHASDAAGTSAFAGAVGTPNGGASASSKSGTAGMPGLAGTGGAASAASIRAPSGVCIDSDLPPSPTDYSTPLQYATKGTATGDNGTFCDPCDADGMLVEHMCEAL
jgi:hypothetical protein